MAKRRTRSGPGFISRILRFFGISSPAVFVMALLSYYGFKLPFSPVPGSELDASNKAVEVTADGLKKLKDKITGKSSTRAESSGNVGIEADDIIAKAKASVGKAVGKVVSKLTPQQEDESMVGEVFDALFGDDPPPRVASKSNTGPMTIPIPLPSTQPSKQPTAPTPVKQPQTPPPVKKKSNEFEDFNPYR